MMKTVKNIPELRFPEFEGEWKENTLGEIATILKGKGISKNDICEYGNSECILYGELYTHYSEVIKNIKSRTNLEQKTLVFSKSNDVIIPSSGETQIDIATASCVTKDGVALGGDLNIIRGNTNGVFLSFYLNYKKKRDIAQLAQGISVVHLYGSQLKNLLLKLPSLPEQQKIASFLSAADQRINLLTQKKEKLEQYKKGIMQQIFSQQLRFKDENGKDYPDWEEKKLYELLSVSKKKNTKNKYSIHDVLSVSGKYGIVNQIEFQGRSFAGASVLLYNVVESGDIVYTKSPLKQNPYGIIKVNKGSAGIVSTLYAVYKCHQDVSGIYLDYYFQIDDHVNSYLRPIVRKGAKNDMKVNNEQVLSGTITLPKYKEQLKIIDFISALDKKIFKVSNQLEKMHSWKKGLLQKMFV